MAKSKTAKHSENAETRGYPRPMLQRHAWTNLNGPWDFAIDAEAVWNRPEAVRWDKRKIIVPFCPESPASQINETGFFDAVWYRRTFAPPKIVAGQRVILHFGAVDYQASVWVNDQLVATHEGGYTPFSADITDSLRNAGEQTIVVQALDDPRDLTKPRGKQDWQLHPHSIWYYRTTGIWQTVWMEVVPAIRIGSLRWTPNVERFEMGLDAKINGRIPAGWSLRVKLASKERVLVDDAYALTHDCLSRKIVLADPGIDDYRNEILWHPNHPNLLEAELELQNESGQVIDRVVSYCAMRQTATVGNRFVLNGRPFHLKFLLNQGYWPASGLTAPDDAALRKDVGLIRAMGFNGVRLHQKIEDPRFLYWADRLGVLVWEEMPSPYRFSAQSIQRITRQWMEAIERDASHPCIIAWVPFNESWGVPDLPHEPAQRDAIQAIYHLTRTLDPTRPVIGNDGWELASSDIIAIHDYEGDPRRIAKRYDVSDESAIKRMLRNQRPGGRVLLLDGFNYQGQPLMLTEFGGIAFSNDWKHTWGYSRAKNAEDFASRYAHLLAVVRAVPIFSGFCYTQFTDTYQEANGLLYMDRTPKFPLDQIAAATRGPSSEDDHKAMDTWRELTRKRLVEMDRAVIAE